MLKRINRHGLIYYLYPEGKDKTRIFHNSKEIIVDVPIEEVNQMWYNWFVGEQYIQNAFSKFNPDEQEFIMTGLTKDEFNELGLEAD